MIHLLMASANCYATTISQAPASSGAIRRRSCFLLRLPLFNPYRLLFYHRLLFYLDNHFSEEDIIRGAGAASRQAPRVLPPFPSPLPSHVSSCSDEDNRSAPPTTSRRAGGGSQRRSHATTSRDERLIGQIKVRTLLLFAFPCCFFPRLVDVFQG